MKKLIIPMLLNAMKKFIVHHIISPSHHYSILISLLLFTYSQGFAQGFAQGRITPQDTPHFVYQSSISVAPLGVGENYIRNDSLAKNGNFSVEIQQLLAYQFNNYFFTGLGVGLDFWFHEEQGGMNTNNIKTSTFIPIFANATVKFMDKKTAPFLFANIGYAFKWQTEKEHDTSFTFWGTEKGVYFQTGLGLNLKFSEKLSLLFSAYYKLQQSNNQYWSDDLNPILTSSSAKNQLFHFIGVKIGILY